MGGVMYFMISPVFRQAMANCSGAIAGQLFVEIEKVSVSEVAMPADSINAARSSKGDLGRSLF